MLVGAGPVLVPVTVAVAVNVAVEVMVEVTGLDEWPLGMQAPPLLEGMARAEPAKRAAVTVRNFILNIPGSCKWKQMRVKE